MSSQIKTIPISSLIVSVENPRFETLDNQREAIQTMIDDQGDKLINLAKDIIDAKMLNPTEFPSVVEDESSKGRYIVLEGNRRVVTLKILANPKLTGGKSSAFDRKLKPLSKQFLSLGIHDIECVVFERAEEAYRWIKLRHTGENDGVGIVRWDAQQVARFDEKVEGKPGVALQVVDFIRREDSQSHGLKERLKIIPTTSLTRLLVDKSIQQVLGITVRDNKITTELQKAEVLKGLKKIVRDLAEKKIKVKDIYTKEDREKYIETFQKNEIPDKSKKSKSTWELGSGASIGLGKGVPKKNIKKPVPLSTDRESVIPKDCILHITYPRINKIYTELKSLEVDHYENAASVLMRVFIEQSIDVYLDAKKIKTVSKDPKLRQKVEAVTKYMQDNGIMTKHDLKPIRTGVSNSNSILSIDTFNAYVHNHLLSPIAKDIKTSWDNIQKFIEKLW